VSSLECRSGSWFKDTWYNISKMWRSGH